ncbi:hypothetical protein Tsubulata_033338, partial [Turnera subulata]
MGNLYCFLGSGLPHHSITNLVKKYGRVMHLQLGERFTVVLSSAEAAKEALKTQELSFAQRPSESIREEEVWDMIESVSNYSQEGKPINLSDKIFSMESSITSRLIFGLKCQDRGELMSLLGELVQMGSSLSDLYPSLRFLRYVSGVKPALERIHKKFDRVVQDIVNDYKMKRELIESSGDVQDHRDTILDVLLKIQESNQLDINLTNERIKTMI